MKAEQRPQYVPDTKHERWIVKQPAGTFGEKRIVSRCGVALDFDEVRRNTEPNPNRYRQELVETLSN